MSGIVGETVRGENLKLFGSREAGEKFGLDGLSLCGSCLVLSYNVLSDPVLLVGGKRWREETIRRVRGMGVMGRGDKGRGPRQRTRGIRVGARLRVRVRVRCGVR